MFKGKTILIVDDEPDLREILQDEFQFEGAEVDGAKSGQEALEKAKARKFDLILSDIRMPGGDGVTLAREIKNIDPSFPAVFLITGFADIKNFEAYDMGAEGFFTKPFHLDILRDNAARVMLPLEERWGGPIPVKVDKEIRLEDGLSSLIKAGKVSVGRGGLFMQVEAIGYKANEIVRVHLGGGLSLWAVVRWSRTELSTLPLGIGIEILHIPEPGRHEVLSWIQSHQPKAYLPQS